jgi:hypothetical protein
LFLGFSIFRIDEKCFGNILDWSFSFYKFLDFLQVEVVAQWTGLYVMKVHYTPKIVVPNIEILRLGFG